MKPDEPDVAVALTSRGLRARAAAMRDDERPLSEVMLARDPEACLFTVTTERFVPGTLVGRSLRRWPFGGSN